MGDEPQRDFMAPASTRTARLVLIASVAAIVLLFLLWEQFDDWFGDAILGAGVLALFALAARAALQLRCRGGGRRG